MFRYFKYLFIFFISLIFFSCATLQSRYHRVREGESLWTIARKYGVSVAQLREANPRAKEKHLQKGVKLYIPFEERPDWNRSVEFVAYHPGDRAPASIRFDWPVAGELSSKYGWRRGRPHQGIDIAAPKGRPVKSARGGHVIYAGNGVRGYGNMVVVRHMDEFASVYAHLSSVDVRKGQFLPKGALIGRVGKTGHATGPHLHFEIRKDRIPVNPLLYLSK